MIGQIRNNIDAASADFTGAGSGFASPQASAILLALAALANASGVLTNNGAGVLSWGAGGGGGGAMFILGGAEAVTFNAFNLGGA